MPPTTAPGPGGLPPIPFNRPALVGRELDYVRQAVEGGHTSAAGPFSKRWPPCCGRPTAPPTSS